MGIREKVESIELRDSSDLCSMLRTDGIFKGSEFECLCSSRNDNNLGSFKFNVESEYWSDFSTGDKGKGVISWYAYDRGISWKESVNEISTIVGIDSNDYYHKPMTPVISKKIYGLSKKRWTGVYKVKDGTEVIATSKPISMYDGAKKKFQTLYDYKRADGKYLLTVGRTKTKSIVPMVVTGVKESKNQIKMVNIAEHRPLANLPEILGSDKPVLFVEGEKCVMKAEELGLDKFTLTTNAGGSNSFSKTDWAPLIGKDVYVWADDDEPGRKIADKINDYLDNCKIIKITKPEDGDPKITGWDIADQIDYFSKKAFDGDAEDIKEATKTLLYRLMDITVVSAVSDKPEKPVVKKKDYGLPIDIIESVKEASLKNYYSEELIHRMNVSLLGNKFLMTGTGSYHYDGKWELDEKILFNNIYVVYHKINDIVLDFLDEIDVKEKIKNKMLMGLEKLKNNILTSTYGQKIYNRFKQLEKITQLPDEKLNIFHFADGTALDLDSMKTRKSEPSDFNLAQAKYPYNPEAPYNKWEHTLNEVFDGDQARIDYFQVVVGRAMRGEATQEEFYFMLGTGSNGKTIVKDVLMDVFGDYSGKMEATTLNNKNGMISAGQYSDIFKCRGKRFIGVSELGTGVFNASLLKSLTGDASISAKPMGKNMVSFPRTFTLFIDGNSVPSFGDRTNGMVRRYKEIAFNHVFKNTGNDSHVIRDNLLSQGSGILNWIIEGYRKSISYVEPKSVVSVSKMRQEENDPVKGFLTDKCIESNTRVIAGQLYYVYREYCMSDGYKAMGKQHFFRALEGYGFKSGIYGANKKYIIGLTCNDIENTSMETNQVIGGSKFELDLGNIGYSPK